MNTRQTISSSTRFFSIIKCCDCVRSRKGSGMCAARQQRMAESTKILVKKQDFVIG